MQNLSTFLRNLFRPSSRRRGPEDPPAIPSSVKVEDVIPTYEIIPSDDSAVPGPTSPDKPRDILEKAGRIVSSDSPSRGKYPRRERPSGC